MSEIGQETFPQWLSMNSQWFPIIIHLTMLKASRQRFQEAWPIIAYWQWFLIKMQCLNPRYCTALPILNDNRHWQHFVERQQYPAPLKQCIGLSKSFGVPSRAAVSFIQTCRNETTLRPMADLSANVYLKRVIKTAPNLASRYFVTNITIKWMFTFQSKLNPRKTRISSETHYRPAVEQRL